MPAVQPESGMDAWPSLVTGAGRRDRGGARRGALGPRSPRRRHRRGRRGRAQATAEALDGPATAMPLDVRDPSAHRAVALAAAGLGDVTVWVNNAGVLSTAPAWEATDDEVTATFEVNTLGLGARLPRGGRRHAPRRHPQHRLALRARADAGLRHLRGEQGRRAELLAGPRHRAGLGAPTDPGAGAVPRRRRHLAGQQGRRTARARRCCSPAHGCSRSTRWWTRRWA